MYELYSNYSPGEDIVTARAKQPISADAVVFLSTMTQIVVDIANAFNENFSNFKLTAIAPSYPTSCTEQVYRYCYPLKSPMTRRSATSMRSGDVVGISVTGSSLLVRSQGYCQIVSQSTFI
jgi:hypothetical protein